MNRRIPGLKKWGGLLAALVMVATAATAADLPGYGGGTSGGSARVHPVKLTSRQAAGIYTIGLAFPIASMDFDLGSAFSGVLYACDDTNVDADGDGVLDASASCQTLATLTADTSNSAMAARKLWYVLDINTAESSGNSSMLTIKGTFDQVASSVTADATDANGDGIYEYVRFPQDFDGDGTTWQTCDCGGGTTPGYTADYICGFFRAGDDDYSQTNYTAGDAADNPVECRFEGQRVWDDASDDLNALYALSSPGFEIDFEPGTYAMKGGNVPTSDAGTQHIPTTCWDSATASYGGTCQTTASGRTLRTAAEFPWSGTVLEGAGVDSNGDMDLVYEGTMFVTNSGPRTFWNTNTVNNGVLSLGLPAVGAEATGGILVEKTLDSDLEATLCLDATFTTDEIVEGSLIQFTLTHAESGRLNRTVARVSRITTNVCGGTGREITVGASTPIAIDQMPDTLYQTYLGQTATVGSVVVVIEEDELAANIDLSRVWFTHLDYIGAGNCDPAGDHEAAACDTGVSLQVNAGFGHKIHDIGVIQTSGSFGSGQVINTTPTSSGVKFEDSIFRFNQGGLIDVPQYAWFRDNVVADNTLLRDNDFLGNLYNQASLVRVQADNYYITSNVFERNVAPIEFDNAQTQAGSAIVEMGGKKGFVGDNLFRMNAMTCVGISKGAREMLLEGNTFDCGSNNRMSTNSADVRDRAYAVVVQSTTSNVTGDLTFRSNRFTGLGGHYLNQIALNIEDPRAHVLFTGVDFNNSVDTAGDLAGLIIFEGNEFAAASDRLSLAVAMRVNSGTSTGDPDAARLWFNDNRVEQGGLFGTVWMGSGTGSASGNLDGLDPDNNNDGVGLPLCGVNYLGDTPQLDYTSTLLDDLTDASVAITLSNANIINGTATPQVNQCDSVHTS